MKIRAVLVAVLGVTLLAGWRPPAPGAYNPDPPASAVKLIFIHHSTGENWLADGNGDLGLRLRDNNYFVSDTNYGWGPGGIGDSTDIGHWWTWFCGPDRDTYVHALYNESERSNDSYTRMPDDPGGENVIVMFKSCFPNSYLGGNPDDPPPAGSNPLRGQDCGSEHHTVGNAKGIYNDLLGYFATRQDKLFVVIAAPPQAEAETDSPHARNARALNNWLVREWLKGYAYRNVAVFDFYNVLTSNGGSPWDNDSGWETGNHHRYWNQTVQHQTQVQRNVSAYPSDDYDSHPTSAGNRKATDEFVRLLNIAYHCWRGEGDCPRSVGSNMAPVIDSFTATPQEGGSPLSVEFVCTAHDPDGQVSQFLWDFQGDGLTDLTTSTGSASFVYTEAGIYAAGCIAVDNGGAYTAASPLTINVRRVKRSGIKR